MSGGFQSCSGTMIGCNTFLTAGHCVCSEDGTTCNPTESSYTVFLQHGGLRAASLITPHPGYNDTLLLNDVAVIQLVAPFDGVPPTPLPSAPPGFGTPGSIVGFGAFQDAPSTGFGIKRSGQIVTVDCTAGLVGGDNSQNLCWDYDIPPGPPGTDSNSCPGDSGGPLFTDEGGTEVVSGVTSFGIGACAGDDFSADANVATFAAWIQSVAGADLSNTSCGSIPQVGSLGATTTTFSGSLAGATDEDFFSFSVPSGDAPLVITLNGRDDGPQDFDLYARFGAPPTTSVNDCSSENAAQFETCGIPAPASGTWHVMARSFAGSGEYQITATSFASGGGSFCGDGVVDSGEQCDDGNVAPGDGCDAACQIELPPDTCPPTPDPACDDPLPEGSKLKLKRAGNPAKNKLTWSWKSPAPTGSDFGDPLGASDYRLCLYDEVASAASLVLEADAFAGAAWKANRSGFKYKAPASTDELTALKLKAGRKVKLQAKAKGIALPALPLSQDGAVRAQLHGDHGACWNAVYSGPAKKSDSGRFQDRSD